MPKRSIEWAITAVLWDGFTLGAALAITDIAWPGGFDPAYFGSGGPVVGFTIEIWSSISGGSQPDIGGVFAPNPLRHYEVSGDAGQSFAGTFGGVALYDYSFSLPTAVEAAPTSTPVPTTTLTMTVSGIATFRLTCTPPLPIPTVTPVTGGAVKCRRAIAMAASKFVAAKTRALQKCGDAGVTHGVPGLCPDARAAEPIAKASRKLSADIGKACGGDDKVCGGNTDNEEPPAGLGWVTCSNFEDGPARACSAPIADCRDITTCIECVGTAAVDQAIALYYGSLTLPSQNKNLSKCQRTIGKARAEFLLAKEKSLQKCWDARLNGKHADSCPDPAAAVGSPPANTAAAIAKAENRKIKVICRACGGGDSACDDTVTAANGTQVAGSGGGDDFTLAAIGFLPVCPAVKVPGGGPLCAQAMTTLADVIECVDCVTEFEVDCVDRLRAAGFVQYPCECYP